jgi:hypothetical protein
MATEDKQAQETGFIVASVQQSATVRPCCVIRGRIPLR